jgi:hypothetical protein
LLDLKEKYVDLDVLKALSTATRDRLNDANGVPIMKFKTKILELFGRLSSLVVSNWKVYWYYADVVLFLSQIDDANNNFNKIDLNDQSAGKYFGLLQKAFRNLYNQSNWELSVEKCKETIEYSTELLKS